MATVHRRTWYTAPGVCISCALGPGLGSSRAETGEYTSSEFGFTVQNMDGHHDQVTKAKLEDLRVGDSEDPGWVGLVEIKGRTKGAKTNDVNQNFG